ncbi:hypothetical protein Ddc_12347 [Ditylenchus destructor]|nr:hypothetical protein Ddc_12347 [Ditylenchus destructor]
MNTFSQSKLQRLKASIGWRRKTAIVLPPETLTHILHYFPRKQLVKRYSRVNSTFFRVANRLLPNVHVIDEDNIKFCFPYVERYSYHNPEAFNGLILYEDRKIDRRSKIERLLCVRAKRDRSEMRISAEKFLENITPAFIRFPSFEDYGFEDESMFQFLRQAKQHFVNSRICLTVGYSDGEKNTMLNKRQELLTDIFLDAAEIFISIANAAPETLFKTNGVRNCDRVAMWFCYKESLFLADQHQHLTKQSTEAFIEWLEWKQHDPGSRRHLVIYAYDRPLELIEDLTQAFKSATKPLNYVVTFIDPSYRYYTQEVVEDLAPFKLENDSTGERLSFFHHQLGAYRLWRRIVNDSGNNYDELDKNFYNYRHPKFYFAMP